MRLRALLLVLFVPLSTFGQAKSYSSSVDESLTVRTVTIVPFVDNLGGIYAKPLTEYLSSLIKEDRQWTLIKSSIPAQGPEELEENQKRILDLLKQTKADALFTGRVSKGPKGITVRITLIGGKEGLPLVRESLEDFSGFETEDLRFQTKRLFTNLKERLPYQALVMSRQGHLITLNLGERHGLKEGDELLVIMITKVERHPKFRFITKAVREIMGRIRVHKVDESVSFATLRNERTANLIQPGFKIARDDHLKYPDLATTADGKLVPRIGERADQEVALGDNPTEYTSVPRASFGRIGLLAGLGSTTLSSTHANGTSAQSVNLTSPVVMLEGEMWLDPRWQFNLDLTQSMVKVPNGLDGSTPDPLNSQRQQMALTFGYNFLAREDFFGPKFQIQAGYTTASLYIDDSTPRAHTSKNYSGMSLAIGGSFPIETEAGNRFIVGGRFLYHLSPSLSESPAESGSATSQMNQFSFFGEMSLSPKLYLKGSLLFDQSSSSFSGGTSNSASAHFTSFLFGMGYMF